MNITTETLEREAKLPHTDLPKNEMTLDKEIQQVFKNGLASAASLSLDKAIHIYEKKGKGLFAKSEIHSEFIQKSSDEVYECKGRIALFDNPDKIQSDGIYKEVLVIDSTKKESVPEIKWAKVDAFAKKIIPQIGKAQSEKVANNNDLVVGVSWVNNEIGGSAASAFDFIQPDPGLDRGLQMTAWLGVASGALGVQTSFESYDSAKEKGDTIGMRLAVYRFIRGVTEIAGSAVSGTRKALALAALQSTAKTISVASSILGMISLAIGSISSILLTGHTIMGLKRSGEFLNGLKEAEKRGEDAALTYLLGLLTLNEEEMKSCKESIAIKNPKDLYALVSKCVLLTNEEKEILTPSNKVRITEMASKIVDDLKKEDYPLIQNWDEVKVNLAGHLSKAFAEKKVIKKADYIRAAGADSYEKLVKSLQDEVKPSNDVIALAKTEARRKIIINALWLFVALLSIASLVVGSVFSAGLPLIIAAVISLVASVMGTALDAQEMLESVKSAKGLSRRDKVFMGLLLLATIASITIGAVFTAGVGPLIAVLVIGAVMLLVQGGCFTYIWNKQKALEEKKFSTSLA